MAEHSTSSDSSANSTVGIKEEIYTVGDFFQQYLLVPNLELIIGIEVDATAGAWTSGQFDLGQPGGGNTPLKGFKTQSSPRSICEGNLHSVKLEVKDLKNKYVRVSACKSNVLDKYDEKTGKITYKDSLYKTEELVAEIFVFNGERCLTGNHKFQDIVKMMEKSQPGINRVLIRLDPDGASLQDCIMDGIVIVQNGKQLVKTGR